MTTKQLAAKFNVKVATIHNLYWKNGHYRGYEPATSAYNGGYKWRFVGE